MPLMVQAAILAGQFLDLFSFNRHFPDNIQIRAKHTTVPFPHYNARYESINLEGEVNHEHKSNHLF
jgi:hypothetical protein